MQEQSPSLQKQILKFLKKVSWLTFIQVLHFVEFCSTAIAIACTTSLEMEDIVYTLKGEKRSEDTVYIF